MQSPAARARMVLLGTAVCVGLTAALVWVTPPPAPEPHAALALAPTVEVPPCGPGAGCVDGGARLWGCQGPRLGFEWYLPWGTQNGFGRRWGDGEGPNGRRCGPGGGAGPGHGDPVDGARP